MCICICLRLYAYVCSTHMYISNAARIPVSTYRILYLRYLYTIYYIYTIQHKFYDIIIHNLVTFLITTINFLAIILLFF